MSISVKILENSPISNFGSELARYLNFELVSIHWFLGIRNSLGPSD